MKLQVLNKEGKKVKEMDTKLFEEPSQMFFWIEHESREY